ALRRHDMGRDTGHRLRDDDAEARLLHRYPAVADVANDDRGLVVEVPRVVGIGPFEAAEDGAVAEDQLAAVAIGGLREAGAAEIPGIAVEPLLRRAAAGAEMRRLAGHAPNLPQGR